MSRTSTLILFGILSVLVPFSGLPIAFRTLLAVIFGASIAGIGLSLRAQGMAPSASTIEPTPLDTEPVPPQGISPI